MVSGPWSVDWFGGARFLGVRVSALGVCFGALLGGLAELFEAEADAFGVAFGDDFGPVPGDLAGGADEEGGADDAAHFLAGDGLIDPGAVLAHDVLGLVGEEADLEFVFVGEELDGHGGIGGDADDFGIEGGELGEEGGELGGLAGAAGGVGLGVEVEDDPFAALG